MEQDTILKDAILEISDDTKLVRLATITTFLHSLLFILYIIYLTSSLIATAHESSNPVVHIVQQYTSWFVASPSLIVTVLVIAIIGFIGYTLLPPVGEAAMISYLHNDKKQGTVSIGKWLSKFFPMFEFDAMVSLFSVMVLIIIGTRLRVMGILRQPFVLTILILWSVIIFFVSLLLPYSRIIITLENMKFLDAVKRSMALSIANIGITFKFVVITYLLYARFLINTLIVVGIPGLMVYGAWALNIVHNTWLQWSIALVVVGLIIFTAYINGIIEAFFTTYRYKVYLSVKDNS